MVSRCPLALGLHVGLGCSGHARWRGCGPSDPGCRPPSDVPGGRRKKAVDQQLLLPREAVCGVLTERYRDRLLYKLTSNCETYRQKSWAAAVRFLRQIPIEEPKSDAVLGNLDLGLGALEAAGVNDDKRQLKLKHYAAKFDPCGAGRVVGSLVRQIHSGRHKGRRAGQKNVFCRHQGCPDRGLTIFGKAQERSHAWWQARP